MKRAPGGDGDPDRERVSSPPTVAAVTRPLTADAPAIDAIVEECFPSGAMTDFKVFFDAPGDEPKFKRNLQRMVQSVARFIEPGQIDVIPTSQYRVL